MELTVPVLAAALAQTTHVLHHRSTDSLTNGNWDGVANLHVLRTHGSTELPAIRESLKPSGFANGYRAHGLGVAHRARLAVHPTGYRRGWLIPGEAPEEAGLSAASVKGRT